MKLWIALLLLLIPFAVGAQENPYSLIDLPENEQIEIFVTKPYAQESSKLLLFLHGANDAGLHSIAKFWLNYWLFKGYVVASISMPGYGKSTGTKDLCGPETIKALMYAIDHIKERVGISQFGILASGQGALAGLLLTAQREDVCCIVCANGAYDLVRHLVAGDLFLENVEKNYSFEITEEAFRIRSPIAYISTIKAPVFILHREGNPFIAETEALDFAEAMRSCSKKCECSIREKIEGSDIEKITYKEMLIETESWVDYRMELSLSS